jgi:hypothetical protein
LVVVLDFSDFELVAELFVGGMPPQLGQTI